MADNVNALARINWADTAVLAVALGCGLLIGIERERRKGSGPGRAFAGIRTFAMASLTGAACMLLGQWPLMLVGAAFVAALGVVAHWRGPVDDPGVTTEIALLLAYLIGALCTSDLALAAALTVVVTALLVAKEGMHRFALHWLQPAEVRDGIVLAALALIALPLLPDRALWGPALNPRTVVTLLLVLLFLQTLAHLCRRLLASRDALALSALAAGFVSSTAAIATWGVQVRRDGAAPRSMAGSALLSCVATQLQLLAVTAAVQPRWLAMLWLPALAGACVAGVWGWVLVRSEPAPQSGASAPSSGERMFSLRSALMVACLLTGIQSAVHAMSLWQGNAGVVAGTLVAALVDLHAAAAAVLVVAQPGSAVAATLPLALSAALAVHAVSKCVTAWLSGGRRYVQALAPGLLLHTALVIALLMAMDGNWRRLMQ